MRVIYSLLKLIMSMIFFVLTLLLMGGCGFDATDDCAPHHEEAVKAPDGRHIAERWISICGFPGSTVTDLISVTEGPTSRPPWSGVFTFNEDQGGANRNQISASWNDDRHLTITVDAVGDVMDSPHQIGDVVVTYVLGPTVDMNVIRTRKQAKADERREWERLKTSASWHYVENNYKIDGYLIDHYQKFIDWVHDNTAPPS